MKISSAERVRKRSKCEQQTNKQTHTISRWQGKCVERPCIFRTKRQVQRVDLDSGARTKIKIRTR